MWANKKYPKKKYTGHYERDSRGERVFVLKRKCDKPHAVMFESHQAAKNLGWKKK